jgi:LacI family transcriptional regulator
MAVTIRDVAQKLGLSIATVSRALAGHSDIALKTRQLVARTAQEMGYTPNRAARQLRRQKADAIGYILPVEANQFSDPFYTEFLVGLGDESAQHPFDLLISVSGKDHLAEQRIYESWVQSRKVDGFVLNRIRHSDWRMGYLSEHNVPFTTVEQGDENYDHPRVEVDNLAGMVMVVEHLAQNGYSRLAFIGGPAYLVINTARLAGFQRGLEMAGLPYDPGLVVSASPTSDGGYQAVKRMRWLPDPPDALVCINDETAFGAIHALHELGLKVGQDVAVTGFDGVLAAGYTDPPLTTLDIPIYEIARQTVRLLAAELDTRPNQDTDVERRVVFQPRLLVRGSSQKQ